MKIFFLYYDYDPVVRKGMGGFRHVGELTEALLRLGHEVTLFAPQLDRSVEKSPVPTIPIPIMDLWGLRPLGVYVASFFLSLFFGCKKHPDVLYIREMFSPGPWWVSRLFRSPLLIELNGDSYEAALRGHFSWLRRRFIYWMQHFNLRQCHAIVAISEGLKKSIQRRYQLDPSKVNVIGNGSNILLFRPLSKKECCVRLSLEVSFRYIGFAGTFFDYQGVGTLIEAAPFILKQCGDARFLIVGDGLMRASWEAEVKKKKLQPYFIFTGQVPYKEVVFYMNAMDVCTAPFLSIRTETSPLKLYDYLACGRPVVASRIPPIQFLIEETEAILPVPPDNPEELARAILFLLEHPEEAEAMGKKGRTVVAQKYSWEAVARKVADLCQEAIKRGRHANA